MQMEDNTNKIKGFYNTRKDLNRRRRNITSPVSGLFCFNNWIKSVLINKYSYENSVALDLCCGKLGDILKWINVGVSYLVAADISEQAIKDAINRYKKEASNMFGATFLCEDCCAIDITNQLNSNVYFDIVSCQFALHYAFESEERLRGLLNNASKRLKPGGYFIGTTLDANLIVKKFRNTQGYTFGNKYYTFDFSAWKNENKSKIKFPAFGAKYLFTLFGAIDAVPEFLAHFGTLEKIAAEYGLVLIEKENFHQFYSNNINRNYQTYVNMGCSKNKISNEEWEIAQYFIVFAFEKLLPQDSDIIIYD